MYFSRQYLFDLVSAWYKEAIIKTSKRRADIMDTVSPNDYDHYHIACFLGYHLVNITDLSLLWRHNGLDGVSNHQHHDCLLTRLFRRKWRKTSKLRVTGLCTDNSPVTGEFSAQMASIAENVSIWWRHHVPYHFVVKLTLDQCVEE